MLHMESIGLIAIYIVGRRKKMEMRRRVRIAWIACSAASVPVAAPPAAGAFCAAGAFFTLAP